MHDVIVIGAGISGLACAYGLRKRGFDVLVLESSDRIGGVIRSVRIDGYLVEAGPNSFAPTPHCLQLLDELDLGKDLLRANPKNPRFVLLNGRLRKVPFGVLTLAGAARALAEPFIRSKASEDESIADFFRRRFGTEVHDRLVAPFVTGVYAGDTRRLSVEASFPRVVELERRYGSVMLGMLRDRRKRPDGRPGAAPAAGRISSFAAGMETLPQRLAADLRVQLNVSGIRIGKDVEARATVLAVPAHRAAEIVEGASPDLARMLASIEYEPVVVAATSFAVESFSRPLCGFGFLTPPSENVQILGTIFSSLLFPKRAPEGRVLLTSFLGGARKPEVMDWPDERVWDVVCSELKRVLGTSLRPDPAAIFRHRRAIPQYTIGHRQRIQSLTTELRRSCGLFVMGNFLEGVSVAACIERGDATAQAVADFLRSKP